MISGSSETIYWDEFWKSRNQFVSDPIVESPFTSLVWKMNMAYWEGIFSLHAPGRAMLECGAGRARISMHMASLREPFRCTMLDNSEEGLALGKSSFSQARLEGKFVAGNVEHLPFHDNTFDVVYSGGLLCLFPSIGQPIKEMIRVLKPGGLFASTIVPRRFCCTTIGDAQRISAKWLYSRVRGQRRSPSLSSNLEMPTHYRNTFSRQEYLQAMEQHGLTQTAASGICPFPALALPKTILRMYVSGMKVARPFWRWFDFSDTGVSNWWGAAISLVGIKKGG